MTAHATRIDNPEKVRKGRVKRQAGLMSALMMVAAAKAVFGGAYIAGSLLKGQKGGNNNNYLPPGKFLRIARHSIAGVIIFIVLQ